MLARNTQPLNTPVTVQGNIGMAQICIPRTYAGQTACFFEASSLQSGSLVPAEQMSFTSFSRHNGKGGQCTLCSKTFVLRSIWQIPCYCFDTDPLGRTRGWVLLTR